jgi:hypothetical protein
MGRVKLGDIRERRFAVNCRHRNSRRGNGGARESTREKGLEWIDARLSFVTYEELTRETPGSDFTSLATTPLLVKAGCISYLEASPSMHISSSGFTFSEGKLMEAWP